MASTVALFPAADPVGPASIALEPAAVAVIAEAVAPFAAEADRLGVTRATLDRLAAAGLVGSPLVPSLQRELGELIAGCDASTWFCWVQHQTPLRILEGQVVGLREAAPEELRHELLPGMSDGSVLGAVAFAHVRRPGAPNPVATRVPGGWRLDGSLDWVTSWDIADVVLVMAQGAGADADVLVCAYLPAGAATVSTPGVVVGPVLDLLAMGGTHTRPIVLDAVHVADERVGALLDRRTWLAADAVRTADAAPSAFGVARGAISELTTLAEQRDDPRMRALAVTLTDECRDIRSRAYALIDEGADSSTIDRRLHVRARSLDVAMRATTAVVVARSGAAMRRGTSAERRAREALFLQVQAQTAATRSATLQLMTKGD